MRIYDIVLSMIACNTDLIFEKAVSFDEGKGVGDFKVSGHVSKNK